MSNIAFTSADEVPQSQGNTIYASHIEQPRVRFIIAFDSSAYRNVLRFAATRRCIFVLAETAGGAMNIASYHYSRGSNFILTGRS